MKCSTFVIGLTLTLFFATGVLFPATGQIDVRIGFEADFENNAGANNADKWNDNSVSPGKHDFKIEDGWLTQSLDGCDNTTTTLLPVNGANWTDYTAAVDIRRRGDLGDANDAISIIFRYTDPDSYYNFSMGGSEGEFNHKWFICDTHALESKCFDDPLPPQKQILAEGDLGIAVDESGATGYTAALRVVGDKIEVFFGEQVDVGGGQMPPKLGEVIDNKYPKGAVGLHTSSCPASFDNVIVFGESFAVDSNGKLSTVWGALKSTD